MIASGSLDSRARLGSYSLETVPTAVPIRLRLVFRTALLVMLPIVIFFTTEGTWRLMKRHTEGGWSSHFFMAQTDAMVHGRLDVARDEIHSECFDVDNRCYGYFGITPSVLRLPLLVKERWSRSGLTPLYLAVAILLAYWGALRLLLRSLRLWGDPARPRLTLGYAVVAALALGPGSTLLFVSRPAVYEEAIAWGVAFFMLTLDRVWSWYETGARRALTLAVIFAIAAANARPSAALACAALGLVVVALSRLRAPRQAVLATALSLALLPGVTACGVYWLKFGTPLADLRLNEQVREASWWRDILQRNGNQTVGAIFAPTEIVAYLRPDAVAFSQHWPFVVFRFPDEPILWVPPLPPNGAYVDVNQPFTSVTATMPLASGVTIVVAIWLGIVGWRLARGGASPVSGAPMLTELEWMFAAGSLASAAAMVGLVVTTVGLVNRYLGDFYALTAVGVALSPRVVLPMLDRRPRLIAPLAIAASLLVAWSLFVTFALNYRLVFG